MANKNIRLLSLEMENFQSITNSIRLDFSPITLLYGPNSAGKSSVFDALELMKLIFNPQQTSSEQIDEVVKKWIHNYPFLKDEEHTLLKLAVEISPKVLAHDEFIPNLIFSSETLNRSYQSLEFGVELEELFNNQKIRYEYEARLVNSEGFAKYVRLDRVSISASIKDNEHEIQMKILEVASDYAGLEVKSVLTNQYSKQQTQIDTSDFFCPGLNVFLYLDDFSKNWAADFNSISKTDFLKSDKNLSGVVVENNFCYGRLSTYDSSVYHIFNSGDFDDGITYARFKEAYIDYLSYFGGLLTSLIDEAFPLVKADRTIPSPDNTLVLNEGLALESISDETSDKRHYGKFKIEDYPIPKMLSEKFKNQEPFFKELAYWSHFHKTYLSLKDSIYSDEINSELISRRHISPKSLEITQFKRVNKYLSDYLFLEKGYRIDSESEYLVSADLIEDLSQDVVVRSPALTRVYLVDTAGRKLEIQDVGSGIAFVLPILVSISQHQISLIQQPELHLHPALQSSLAEVFIDRLNESYTDDFWQSVIETHSEHLILRILRRIRETEQGRNTDSIIRPIDVAVYYFNPLPEGGTELRKMLITPLGDFYNTWPRGFFDERNKDIFDE